MGSFKLRLVIYFMLLALLPLVAATVAFSEVAQRGETGSADARLSTALRVALADYQEQRDVASLDLFEATDAIASFSWNLNDVRDLHEKLAKAMSREVKQLVGA